ncbi:MAG TPA: hypothetical protein VFY48_01340 [Solirubrobacterales bacterium]|nr:hypothetical protein [Solirubrobacterales bacterium]
MKFLLIPLGIAAFVLFLLVLGAVGLLVSMAIISAFGRLWRLVFRGPAGAPRGS